jgi:RimJ/RimL family protein N-acetyltransferase
MNNIQITSDRFLLKSLSEKNDLSNYLNWLRNPRDIPFVLGARTDYNLIQLKDYINHNNLNNDSILLGIFDKFGLNHIGNIRYHDLDFKNMSANPGILIGEKKYRGVRVASEVIKSSMNWLRSEFDITTFKLGVDSRNIASRKLYEKLGSQYENSESKSKMIISIKFYAIV